jgi:hypothetical protein
MRIDINIHIHISINIYIYINIYTGGGIWRTKWNLINENKSYLFLSGMQNGSAVVEYNTSTSTINPINNTINPSDDTINPINNTINPRDSNVKLKKIISHKDKHPDHLAYGIDLITVKLYNPRDISNYKVHDVYSSFHINGRVHTITYICIYISVFMHTLPLFL